MSSFANKSLEPCSTYTPGVARIDTVLSGRRNGDCISHGELMKMIFGKVIWATVRRNTATVRQAPRYKRKDKEAWTVRATPLGMLYRICSAHGLQSVGVQSPCLRGVIRIGIRGGM